MTNAGRKLRRWTFAEIAQLNQLYTAGKSRAEIAAALGTTDARVRQRLQWECQSSTLGMARKKRRMERRKQANSELRSPREFFDMVTSGPKPTEEALRSREARWAAMPRDLTGAFFGDPPVGFSALEQRA